ncbi:hypothetical protein EDB81DRAFT_756486 [Dactylonectria macrodidyma]|uniref:Uncharacterized protein n=1 Tax=Dactylonectria macrodidyma TaxID=307937 RepID=A0A9P9F864_9HYPO|nr:hypothetical protein EDB81DRAFT_756486 [Dactylonectria macrodidyma]
MVALGAVSDRNGNKSSWNIRLSVSHGTSASAWWRCDRSTTKPGTVAYRSPLPAAWKVLTWLTNNFVTVLDEVAVEGMKELASGRGGDIPIICRESSAANMGVMLQASNDQALREKLGLDENSQVVLFGLEGATDPTIYKKPVGRLACSGIKQLCPITSPPDLARPPASVLATVVIEVRL